MTLVSIHNLNVTFNGTTPVTRDVSLQIKQGEILGLVGESGSGKSVTARALMRLDEAAGAGIDGRILFGDKGDLLDKSESDMRSLRGDRIAMVLQDPMSSLNPSHRVGDQIAEMFRLHRGLSKSDAKARAVELLEQVGFPRPAAQARQYPHQFSGGMRQRAVIAMALACEPDLLIADEPTTALDVTVQAKILKLFRTLRDETGTAILFITHDLGVVAQLCDRVAVLYGGRIVEEAGVQDLFTHPAHPYTRALLKSVPVPGMSETLEPIPGEPPDPADPPPGCPFAPRCPLADAECERHPPMKPRYGTGHQSACWKEPVHDG